MLCYDEAHGVRRGHPQHHDHITAAEHDDVSVITPRVFIMEDHYINIGGTGGPRPAPCSFERNCPTSSVPRGALGEVLARHVLLLYWVRGFLLRPRFYRCQCGRRRATRRGCCVRRRDGDAFEVFVVGEICEVGVRLEYGRSVQAFHGHVQQHRTGRRRICTIMTFSSIVVQV